jgi:copper(I)-binding protein
MKNIFTLSALMFALGLAHAQNVEVKDAWARPSVQGQQATGAFMKITAKEKLQLLSVSSPVAGVAEVHEMKMEGSVMRMRAVSALDLPAGQTVELKPGGYHVMLMDLKTPLLKDTTVPLTLVFKDAKGVQSKMDMALPIAIRAPGASAPAMDHQHHKH